MILAARPLVARLVRPRATSQSARAMASTASWNSNSDRGRQTFASWSLLLAACGGAAVAGSVTMMEKRPDVKSLNLPSVVKYEDISVWKKGNRIIYIQAARNYSQFSADLAARLVKDVKPQAVFVDITDLVARDFKIYDRVESIRKGDPPTGDKIVMEHEIEGTLPPIPNHASEGRILPFIWYDKFMIDRTIKSVFQQLAYAGKLPDEDKAISGEHFVQAIAKGEEVGSFIVLGGRDFDISKQRMDEAVEKTDQGMAAELPALIKETWQSDASPYENFRRVRTQMESKMPAFYQVTFTEADAHLATKLDKMDRFQSVVAVVMLIHALGVEENLKNKGWEKVQTK